MLQIEHLISDENRILRKNMRTGFRPFGTDNNVVENMVIDTGAPENIISPDGVEDIGIFAEPVDSVNSFYGLGGS